VSEQFGFEQVVGQRAAVHGNQGSVPSRPGQVQRGGGQFLAGAGFARDQDRGTAAAHHIDQVGDPADGRAPSDEEAFPVGPVGTRLSRSRAGRPACCCELHGDSREAIGGERENFSGRERKGVELRLKLFAGSTDMFCDGEVGRMKIYDHSLTGAAASEASRPQETHKAGNSRESGRSSEATGDRVEFSGHLGALSRAVSSDQSARSSRIEALSAQVAQGTYRPDSHAVSRGMIDEALAQ
jgi:flagellar biosynthesis anti-sigma factor FlgM